MSTAKRHAQKEDVMSEELKPDEKGPDTPFGEPVPSEKYNFGWEFESSLQCSMVEGQLGLSLGKVLTIVDATVSDGRQNKACKDLVRAEFNRVMGVFRRVAMPSDYGEPGYKLQPLFE